MQRKHSISTEEKVRNFIIRTADLFALLGSIFMLLNSRDGDLEGWLLDSRDGSIGGLLLNKSDGSIGGLLC